MNKPEILQGEVKELDLLIKELRHRGTAWQRTLLYDYTDFYSQPFKPEMITEYFEGWNTTNGKFYFKDNSDKFEFGEDTQSSVKIVRFFPHSFFVPKTLSQFITNCIQAGIKLTWKAK